MTNASTRKSAAAAKRSPLTLAGVGHGLQGWLIRNKFYIIAFFIPVALTYLAYALFGISPFGEESVLCLDLNGSMCTTLSPCGTLFGEMAASSITGRETSPATLWVSLAIILPARLR